MNHLKRFNQQDLNISEIEKLEIEDIFRDISDEFSLKVCHTSAEIEGTYKMWYCLDRIQFDIFCQNDVERRNIRRFIHKNFQLRIISIGFNCRLNTTNNRNEISIYIEKKK